MRPAWCFHQFNYKKNLLNCFEAVSCRHRNYAGADNSVSDGMKIVGANAQYRATFNGRLNYRVQLGHLFVPLICLVLQRDGLVCMRWIEVALYSAFASVKMSQIKKCHNLCREDENEVREWFWEVQLYLDWENFDYDKSGLVQTSNPTCAEPNAN